MRRLWHIGVMIGVLALVFAPAPLLSAPAQPQRGGVIRHAHTGDPPSLDLHWTSVTITRDIGVHMYEGLFALNAAYEPRPLLVERWTMSPNRLLYTFYLRKGVQFHNGKEMVADDVIASLTRWGRVAARGRELFRDVQSLTAPDRYTVELRMREPNALTLLNLGFPGQGAVIYPKEVVDEAGTGQIRRFIGTGPYKFGEYLPDRHVRLDRFDQYKSVDEAPSGFAGRREAYVDSIFFLSLPDPAVRVAGVTRGEYQFADTVPHDEFPRLQGVRGVVPFVIPVPAWQGFIFNKRQGVMTDVRMRRAVQVALDMDAILRGTFGPRQFWRVDPGMMPKEHPLWNDAGKEFYNQKNPERARQLLAEAGYRGQPIRWLVSSEFVPHLTATSIAKAQLERAGFVIDLQVSDTATVGTRRARPDLYDVFTTGFSFVPDPTNLLVLLPSFPGWYESREMDAHLKLLTRHTDPKVRKEIWKRAQRQFYEDAATVKIGDWYWLHALREEVKGFTGVPGPYYWNVWLDRR